VGVALGLTPHNQHNPARKYGSSLRLHVPPHHPPPRRPRHTALTLTPLPAHKCVGGVCEDTPPLCHPRWPLALANAWGVSPTTPCHHASSTMPPPTSLTLANACGLSLDYIIHSDLQ
jgi:hypothetical protein